MNEKEIRFIDLFGGVGGFRLGLEQNIGNITNLQGGWNKNTRGTQGLQQNGNIPCSQKSRFVCVAYYDNDKYAVQTYNKNFKENHKPVDIRDVKAESIPEHDMLCAGFPCQSFSIAGKRKGFEDTRGTLFFEICRIAEHHRPRLLFLENVKGLLSHDNGETFRTILKSMDNLGYDAEWQVLNSKDFGVPQNRERVFIIGHLRGESSRQIFPVFPSHTGDNEEGETMPTLRGFGHGWQGQHNSTHSVMIASCLDTNYHKGNSPSHREQKRTIRTEIMITEEKRIRRLTPVECERLQGFPDGWTEKGKLFKSVKLIGNIWKDVQLQNVKEEFAIENQNCALNTIKDGRNGEILTLSIQTKEKIKENVVWKGVIEKHIVENGVCDTINLGNDMVMFYKVNKTSKYETLTKKNLIKEKMEEQSTYPLWKIILEENLKKEKLSTILTLIRKTILSKTFICVKTGKPITDVIIVWKKLEQNLLEKESLNLIMENIISISDTQRYKQMGNAVTVNVIEAIGGKI